MFAPPVKLTDRQQELLAYLRQHQREQGVMPSTRDIQRHFGFSSQTAAMSHLRALEKKGVIQRHPHKARAVVFPEDLQREEIVDIPLYGHIAAGYAEMQQQEPDGTLSLDAATIGVNRGSKAFALRVRGESMIGVNICDGDIAILEVKEPRPRDIVAALIDGETTLKRYLVENGRAFLRAENPAFPDLMPDEELQVQGVLKTLIRRMD
ncbi:transcriptional repressor LexA [Brevifollis gellanilyticus]|uniref:LexA repressor n=1 Tax=Brevifollis gellanilyticus TaxID=748831 RepID=A0A512MF86_9BACT|nr:transcriptional repressor LexA [Brevifollis gellanilyticus]GEP45409.1 LexA repressor [Brevifollis gellanilyticus]